MVDRRKKFGRLVDKIESPSKIWTDGRTKEGRATKKLYKDITLLGKIIRPFFIFFILVPFVYLPKYLFIIIKFLTKYFLFSVKFIFKKTPLVMGYLLSKFRNKNISKNK